MTLVQMESRSTRVNPVHRTVGDAPEAAALRVCDDLTVEVASAVMAGARTGHLLVCDDDGVCTGLVTQAQLAAIRQGDTYTDRVRLREVLVDRGPFASLSTTRAEAEHPMRHRRLDALPVVDGRGRPSGVLALAH
ncbi:CBS domain-containing protein [Streptomyces sp. H34-S4]|uniref:CBS domain-containing protein n=1 Tax=Streptomyces sp. H34-S4 TaxID=2996463 RepID=UPI002270F79D|nr:CBS domain-containing protein [Streptomyces sp. H34-S4]MCY0934133.1 CBS domain-containing protein [Streptomyces sp. H34-S4]